MTVSEWKLIQMENGSTKISVVAEDISAADSENFTRNIASLSNTKNSSEISTLWSVRPNVPYREDVYCAKLIHFAENFVSTLGE